MPVSFFYIFFVFFLLANIFSRYSGALCCVVPAFGPHCPRPSRVSTFFFCCFSLLTLSFSRASPHLPHATSTPLPRPLPAPSTPCLCTVSTPLASAWDSFHYKWVIFFSFYCLPPLTLAFRASLTPGTCSSPMPRPHPSSTLATARVCLRNFVSSFFLFLFVSPSLTCSMPACHIPTPHGVTPPLPRRRPVASTPGPLRQHPWRSLRRCPGLGPIIFTID